MKNRHKDVTLQGGATNSSKALALKLLLLAQNNQYLFLQTDIVFLTQTLRWFTDSMSPGMTVGSNTKTTCVGRWLYFVCFHTPKNVMTFTYQLWNFVTYQFTRWFSPVQSKSAILIPQDYFILGLDERFIFMKQVPRKRWTNTYLKSAHWYKC